MTTFVVSLFLPYTVDFEEPEEEDRIVPPQPFEPTKLADQGRQGSTTSLNPIVSTDSLLKGYAIPEKAPKTPAQEGYFNFGQGSPAAHFLKPNDPKTLVRSDAHVPEWGTSGLVFNQPRSKLDPAPPGSILEYAKAEERAQARRERLRIKALFRKTSDGDDRWKQEYTVVPAAQGNGGLSNAIRISVDNGTLTDVFTVGLIGFPTDVLDEDKKAEIYEKLEEEHHAISVFVSDKDYDGHYARFCKTILWPVFHYIIPDHPKSKAFLDHSWQFYVNVNKAFAEKVVKNYKRADTIWINDYHLCLVPAMIRQKLPDAKIGFFLHTAFPSSEVFRCLAARREILEGMLGANLVAFQVHEYAHHFLQTCSRILAVEATEDGVQLETRFVNVSSSPIGIDPSVLNMAREDEQVKESIDTMLRQYKGKKVIVARDKLDSIRGVRQKLLSFELFLTKHPEWKEHVVLIQVATSTMEDQNLAVTVGDIVSRIDANHSTLTHNPLVFLRQDIAFSEYLGLLSVADALAITSVREGMNLTCHEFICCQDGQYHSKKYAPVILSEFTGSSAIFGNDAILVNPWDHSGIADAFKKALEMGDEEKESRYLKLRAAVDSCTGEAWMKGLVEKLNEVHEEQYKRDNMSIPRLSSGELLKSYQASSKRLFLLDYEGTLASYGAVKTAVLSNIDRVRHVLRDLVSDEKNSVYIMSGLTVEELELVFNRVPGLGLIAENGCFLREGNADGWTQFPDESKTAKWMEAIKQILKYYVERVEGSWVEERHCSLILHYGNTAEPELASRQAGECANHINDISESQHVKAIPTKDSVIIEPTDFNKSTAAKHAFSKYTSSDRPEFLFVAGNDRDDESLFKWAKGIKEDGTIRNVSSVTMGARNSLAMSTLTNGATGLLSVLTKLVRHKSA